MFLPSNFTNQAAKIITQMQQKNLMLVCAESCTGGLLSALFTEISGSSKVIERGYVTYSNEAKIELLGDRKSVV
jgi:nicotinamide-nucleotide amidase